MLAHRLEEVRTRIAAAAARAGREFREITVMAVTKKFPSSVIRDAYESGIRNFGENYVQEFERKHPDVADLEGARFHLIGRLQSNKSRRAAEIFSAIDSVDSVRLVRRLQDQVSQPLDIMIEVKLAEEEAKSGAPENEVADIIAAVRESPQLRLTGLMTMPPWSEDAEQSRPYFRRLRELASRLGISGLSMGMSNDLEVGIEEGATIVRIGTALFGPRPIG